MFRFFILSSVQDVQRKSDFITGHEPILCIVMRAYCQNVYEDSFKREILLQQAREASNEYLKAATLL